MDGLNLAYMISKMGYLIKSRTRTSVVVLVDGNRLERMKDLANSLNSLGAKVDPSLRGSSIGGILVGDVKILIKATGRTGGLDVEAAAISALQDSVFNAMGAVGGPINVKMKGRTVAGVAGVKKTNGTPKSDFHLVDVNGRPLVHISHKKGSKPNDFQQWGGITEREIALHKEIQYFEQQVNMIYPGNKMPNGESAYMRIKDKKLKMMSVYGVRYNSGSINENRVDVLLQGDPGLKSLGGKNYELTATGNVHYLMEDITGGFEPVLAVIYKGDRAQLGLAGARASIYPIGGRAFKREIPNKS